MFTVSRARLRRRATRRARSNASRARSNASRARAFSFYVSHVGSFTHSTTQKRHRAPPGFDLFDLTRSGRPRNRASPSPNADRGAETSDGGRARRRDRARRTVARAVCSHDRVGRTERSARTRERRTRRRTRTTRARTIERRAIVVEARADSARLERVDPTARSILRGFKARV